jgi:hypothetical protein
MSMILWGVGIWLALQLPAAILLGRFIRTGHGEEAGHPASAPVLRFRRRVKAAGVQARTAMVAGYHRVGGGRAG